MWSSSLPWDAGSENLSIHRPQVVMVLESHESGSWKRYDTPHTPPMLEMLNELLACNVPPSNYERGEGKNQIR